MLSQPSSTLRADYILTAAIAAVAVMVLGLVLVLGAGARNYREANDERLATRGARNAAIAFAQAENDILVAQSSYIATHAPGALATLASAKNEAEREIEAIRGFSAGDGATLAILARIETQSQALFDTIDVGVSTRSRSAARDARTLQISEAIEADLGALHASIIQRADRSRAEEEATRSRTDSLAGALALLSLVTSALAILALRREREQWRLATEAAEEARERAHASDLAKTRFLAVASHDMRQPLHALTLYLSALERRVESQEARDIITKMDRATQSMVGMFSTLLDLARIQAGVVKPEFEIVRAQHVIDRIVAEHPGNAVQAAATDLAIRTDPLLLERVLRNLVTNALKHGGGKAQITASASGGEVLISVTDNGPGIPPEDRERIFEEFVRLEGRAEGLGLGLAIVKRIADILEMPIDVGSAPGGSGARFVLHAQRAVEEPEQAAEETTLSLNGAAVLVVDDDALAREAVGRSLVDLGAEVQTAANETEAGVILGQGFTPRLLVMDLRIDGELVGVEIGKRLQRAITPTPEVIVVTGDTGPETLTLLRGSGFTWLIKPVSPSDLGRTAMEQLSAA